MACKCSENSNFFLSNNVHHPGLNLLTAKIVKATAKLLQSGASESDITELVEALVSFPDASESSGNQTSLQDNNPVASPLLVPFHSIGNSWQNWDIPDDDFKEASFLETFPATFSLKAKLTGAAYSSLGNDFQTLGQMSSSDALVAASIQIGKAWIKVGQSFEALSQMLVNGSTFGKHLKEPADILELNWNELEKIVAQTEHSLANSMSNDNLVFLSQQIRQFRNAVQGLTYNLSVPLKGNQTNLFSYSLAFGRANASLATAMSSLIIASVGPPVETLYTCSPRCPYLGCTSWCTRRYTTPTCTPWRRIIGGVGGPTGLYHRVCTWVVQETEKSICSCYPTRWDRFLSQNSCGTFTTTRSAFTTDRTQEWSAILGTPPAATPPAAFTTTSPGAC